MTTGRPPCLLGGLLLLSVTAGCGADAAILTSWVVNAAATSSVAWETPACVTVSPSLSFGVGAVRGRFVGGGFTQNEGFEFPTCAPPTASGILPAPPSFGTSVDLFDGDVRVGRMEHETLWEPRTLALDAPATVRVGDTLTVTMSHDDTVARAFFRFSNGAGPLVRDATRDGVAFSVVVPPEAAGATVIGVVLEDPQVPVSCTASGDFTCVFTLGGIDPEAGITTFLELEADRPPILARP